MGSAYPRAVPLSRRLNREFAAPPSFLCRLIIFLHSAKSSVAHGERLANSPPRGGLAHAIVVRLPAHLIDVVGGTVGVLAVA